MWRKLADLIARWRAPRRQISIELTPEEQIAVLFLTRFGRGSDEEIAQEVAVRRWVEPHMVMTALFNLQLKGLARLAEGSPAAGAVYVPTPRAFKVAGLLPAEPVSSMQVYLTVEASPRQQPGPR